MSSGLWEQLTSEERADIEEGEEAMQVMDRHETVERWYKIGRCANRLQTAAMRLAMTNKPIGKNYNAAWKELAARSPAVGRLNSATRTHAMWLDSEWSQVNAWLNTLAANQRYALNHPTAVRRRYDAAHKPPSPDKPEGATTPRQAMQDQIIRLQEENDEANKQLEAREREVAEQQDTISILTTRLEALQAELTTAQNELNRRYAPRRNKAESEQATEPPVVDVQPAKRRGRASAAKSNPKPPSEAQWPE